MKWQMKSSAFIKDYINILFLFKDFILPLFDDRAGCGVPSTRWATETHLLYIYISYKYSHTKARQEVPQSKSKMAPIAVSRADRWHDMKPFFFPDVMLFRNKTRKCGNKNILCFPPTGFECLCQMNHQPQLAKTAVSHTSLHLTPRL